MRHHLRGPARTRTSFLVVGLAGVVLLATVIPTASLASVPPSTSLAPAPGANTTTSAVFASQAGYSAADLALVPQTQPAEGSQLVVLTFQSRNPALFDAPATDEVPLTLPQIADEFGLTPAQYASVESYLVSQGLSIVHTWPDRLSLTVEGSVGSLDRAFSTSIVAGTYEGRAVTFPATPPALPAPLESLVESVVGLSTGFDTFRFPPILDPSSVKPSAGDDNLITPAIARSIYDVSPLYNLTSTPTYATSEAIALLLWGDGYGRNDVETFFQQYYPSSFPSPSLVAQPVDGALPPSDQTPSDPCQTAEELTLDLEWSGSMAPGATLYAVYAPGTAYPTCSPTAASMADALATAIDLPVAAVSMSFGVAESEDSSLRAAFDTDLAAATQKGIALFAATGDLGGAAEHGCQGGPAPSYPATFPDVLAVGGTDVSLSRNLLGQFTGFSESAWNLSGGGFSTQFPAPAWQPPGNAYRGTPDVSASAAFDFLYYQASPEVANGTSFATPLWAGLVTEMEALAGRSLAPLVPRIWAIGQAEPTGKVAPGIVDVTSGSTCIGTAGPGWDPETGWGSPRGFLLYEDLTATFVTLSLGVTPSLVGPGGSLTITGHLANETSGASIPDVPVQVALTSSTNIGPCTGTFATAEPSTDAEGNISVTVSVPWCYFGAHAVVDLTVVADGYYGVNSTTVPVNLVGYAPELTWVTDYPNNLIFFVGVFVLASVVGYLLGRPPASSRGSAGGTVAPTSAPPPSTPAPSPPPPSPGAPTGPGTSALPSPVNDPASRTSEDLPMGPPTSIGSSETPQKP